LPLLKHTSEIKEFVSLLPSNTGGKKKGQKYQYDSTKLAGNWFNKGGKARQINRSKNF